MGGAERDLHKYVKKCESASVLRMLYKLLTSFVKIF